MDYFKKDMMFLIKLVKALAVLHNLFVEQHSVPKSWLSVDYLINSDWDDDLDEDLFLSPSLPVSSHSEAKRQEEVQNFLRAKLQ
jgi:hypothetical protein